MMQFAEAQIGWESRSFLKNVFQKACDFTHINQILRSACGIVDFFETPSEAADFACYLSESHDLVQEQDRTAYGDFQTNPDLANRVVRFLKQEGATPALLLEPTFGKGNFIVAALSAFPYLQTVVGIEIYKPYVWATKFSILQYFLEHKDQPPPTLMLDDTCYFIGFARYDDAAIAFALLNHTNVTNLLNAIAFADAKRMYTKEILQRIDLAAVATSVSTAEIQKICRTARLTEIPGEERIIAFLECLRPTTATQAQLEFF
ncbi:MAG: hypothetical protein ABMA02_10930 [Saprospiraceae bacterium]